MKHLALFRTTLLAGALAAAAIAAAGPVGQVVALQGQAVAVGADGVERALALSAPVMLNDRILTRDASKLQILFDDDTVISQGEKSEMVIDEYVYAPRRAGRNTCTLGMARGLFRVLTAEITRLNPDRFKARTKMATIGIRGCDLGFRLVPDAEDIYIIGLGTNEAVVIRQTVGLPPGAAPKDLVIDRAGCVVELRLAREAVVRDLPAALLVDFLDQTDPRRGGAGGGAGDGGGGLLLAGLMQAGLEPLPDPPGQPDPPPPDEPTPPTEPGDTTPPDGGGGDGGGNGTPQPPPQPPPVFVPRGAGTDWQWGTWELGDVVQSVEFSSDRLVSATDFQAIADGARLYNLSGEGDAGAVITHDGVNTFVQGGCALNVQVGMRVAPNWDGTFTMSNNRGASLSFEAEGTFATDGRMNGNSLAYWMQVNGSTFGQSSIVSESITGRLVGPGTGAAPFSGAYGQFSFNHGGATVVNGGFGADLGAPAGL